MDIWINLRINKDRKILEAWEDGSEYEADFENVDFSKITVDTIINAVLKDRKRAQIEEENPFDF